ncbi:uncharacterized protein LOC116265800 [Nymphaea colorata]|nr:uncharacterized protein LOC116265800 [Nymphaea colorata]
MEGEGKGKAVKKKEETSTSSSFSFSNIALDDDLFKLVDDAAPASRSLKFQPKFKPKPKPKGASPSTSIKQESVPIKPEPDANPKPELAEPVDAAIDCTPMDVDPSTDVGNDEPESVSPQGNRVVQEIDVFFNPSPVDVNAQLYIIQYPLRPCWRPYELNERCQEVRVKPKQSKVEVDLAIDVRSENYDSTVEDSLRIEKQTLSSSKTPPVTGYAVGFLIGKKLHLNPIHAVVQLRPSMAYLNASQGPMRKSGGVEMKDGSVKSAEPSNRPAMVNKDGSGLVGTQSKRPMSYAQIKQENDSEAWISLEYLGTDSPSANRYQQQLVSEDVSSVHLSMHLDDYINSLVPGRPVSLLTGKSKSDGRTDMLGRRIDKLPWEHWLERWYVAEHIQVARFADIMRVAYGSTEQDVLQELQQNAHLVKGLWVPKSKFRYEGVLAAVRDYALLMFHKLGTVEHEKLKDSLKNINDPEGKVRTVLAPLALLRHASGTWVLHKPADKSFLDNYPEVVKEQHRAWLASEQDIKATLSTFAVSNSMKTMVAPRKVIVANKQLSANKLEQHVGQGQSSKAALEKSMISDELREAFPKVLREVFHKYSVCSLQLLRQGLREMAISRTTHPKHNSELVVAAARVASSVPNSELQSILSTVAVEINGVYVLESLNDPCDEFRRFVIKLLKARGPNAKVKKIETLEAFKMHCNVEVPRPIYNKVMNELCVSVGNAWMMKSGDGKPP